jgi:hypothetical protein
VHDPRDTKILSADHLLVKRTKHMYVIRTEWMKKAWFEVPKP